jgi:O-antigen/teichoic acid export membrane protein
VKSKTESLMSSFDQLDAAGRQSERFRRAKLTAAASIVGKAIQLASMLLTVPLTLHYLGEERFGLWMTITAVLTVVSFADFGIGNGLLNAVADAHGRSNLDRAREFVSTALVLLTTVALGIGALLVIAAPLLDWAAFFNVHGSLARSEARSACLAVGACLALNLPLGIVQRVQLGLQEGFVANLWQALGTLLGLIGVVLAVRARAPLPLLVLAFSGGPTIALALSAVVEFGVRHRQLRPRLALVRKETTRQLLHTGGLFFVAQVGTLIVSNGASFAIARIVSADAVAPYSIAMRPIQALTLLTTVWAMPLWPAYAEAWARGDYAWVSATLTRTLRAGLTISIACAVIFFACNGWLLARWVGAAHVPDRLTVAGACLFLVGNSARCTASMCLNGIGRLRGQVVYQLLLGLVAIGLCVFARPVLTSARIALLFGLTECAVAACLSVEALTIRLSQLSPSTAQS